MPEVEHPSIQSAKRTVQEAWCLHRAGLQHALAQRARQVEVVIRMDARVICVHVDRTAAELHTGEILSGNLILAADGLWSTAR